MKKKPDFSKAITNIPQAKSIKLNPIEILKTLKNENDKNNLEEEKIVVSFRFFDRENKYFNMGNSDVGWFMSVLDNLNLLSSITKKQLFSDYKNKFRPHPYDDVEKLNFKDEYLTNEQYEAWQLRINKSKGRIHGFFVGNIFYIRFLDKEHNMYNDKIYGGIKMYSEPLTSYEILEAEKVELEKKNKILVAVSEKNYNILCDNCIDCPKDISSKFIT